MVNIYRLKVEEGGDLGEGQTFRDVDIKHYCLTFFRGTSMGGFPMIIKQPGILKKFFWLCSIAIMAAGLWWECSVFFDKFLQWETSTSVSIETSRRLYFPAITICNNNPVVYDWYNATAFALSFQQTSSGESAATTTVPAVRKKRQVLRDEQLLRREKRSGAIIASLTGTANTVASSGGTYTGSGGTVSVSNTDNVKQFDSSPQFSESMQELLKIQETASKVAYPERSVAGHQLCDMILECQYGGVACNPGTDFKTWHWNSQFGNCYTFNAGFLAAESPASGQTTTTWNLKRGGDANDTGIKISKLPGDSYGLYLLLNADIDHYVPTTTQIGWRITVHNQTDMPFPDESGVFVAPGTSTRIGLSLNYIKQLGYRSNFLYTAEYSDCVVDDNLYHDDTRNAYTNQMEVSYSSSACYKTCYQKVVIKACGCFDFLYPSRGSAFGIPLNGNDSTIPPCSYHNSTQWTCRNTISAFHQADALNCSDTCRENCKGYAFGVTMSSMKWPNPSATTMKTLCGKISSIITKRLRRDDATCNGTSYMRKMVESNLQFKLQSDLDDCLSGTFTDPNVQSYYQFADYIIGNSFAEVYIYYRDFNFQSVVASETYQLPDLIAYMGGILGLFFGFSFMTMMEYVMLLFDLIGILVGKLTLLCCKNKVADGETVSQRLSSSIITPTSVASRIAIGYPLPAADLVYGPPGSYPKTALISETIN